MINRKLEWLIPKPATGVDSDDDAELSALELDSLMNDADGTKPMPKIYVGVGCIHCDVCGLHVDPDVENITCPDKFCPFIEFNDPTDGITELDFNNDDGC